VVSVLGDPGDMGN